MTSGDVGTLMLMLDKHFAETAKQLSDMRRDNAEFREQIRQDMRDIEDRVTARIDALDEKFSRRVDNLQAQVSVMHDDITGLKHDVAGLYHWDYWLLSIILVIFAMPQIVAGLKSLFSAVAEGLGLILSVFRRGGSE